MLSVLFHKLLFLYSIFLQVTKNNGEKIPDLLPAFSVFVLSVNEVRYKRISRRGFYFYWSDIQ